MNAILKPVLNAKVTLIASRFVLASFFLIAGIFGVFNFQAVVAEMIEAYLPAPDILALATITTQLVGSILLVTNLKNLAWCGALMLAGFTLLCIPLGHPFWLVQDQAIRQAEMQIALEHFALSGGLIIAAINQASLNKN